MSLRDGFHSFLSVLDRAFTLVHFTNKRRSNGRRDNVKYALLHAGVVAGWTFFISLASYRLVFFDNPLKCLYGAFVNAGLMFFSVLMVKLGLINVAEKAERISGS